LVAFIRTHFVPVIVDSYLVGTPEEKKFYDKAGAVTNGFLVAAASGKRVGWTNADEGAGDPGFLGKLLDEYRRLPEADRKPVLTKSLGQEDPDQMPPSLPGGGLTLIVYNTPLEEKTASRELVRARNLMAPGPSWVLETPITHNELLWLTRDEWQALIPQNPQKGQKGGVPGTAQRRLFRFHGFDWSIGVNQNWMPDLRSGDLTWTVEEVSAEEIRLRLQGFSKVGLGQEDSKKAKASLDGLGSDLNYLGWMKFNRAKKAIVDFRMVALGETWTKWNRKTEKMDDELHFYPTGLVVELASDCSANRTGWPNAAPRRLLHERINYWDPGK
jgi:hypothetical protein